MTYQKYPLTIGALVSCTEIDYFHQPLPPIQCWEGRKHPSMQRSNIQTWDHVVIIFFCAPLLRQLPLCSLPCHSLSADAEGCAAGLVFMCVSRASLACCDCYPQRLFGKLGAATAVSGFRAKELDPIIGVATATRFARESKRRLQTTHVWATRKYRRARSSPSATLWAAPSDINDALLAAGAAEER